MRAVLSEMLFQNSESPANISLPPGLPPDALTQGGTARHGCTARSVENCGNLECRRWRGMQRDGDFRFSRPPRSTAPASLRWGRVWQAVSSHSPARAQAAEAERKTAGHAARRYA
jgi:hypothetical protein